MLLPEVERHGLGLFAVSILDALISLLRHWDRERKVDRSYYHVCWSLAGDRGVLNGEAFCREIGTLVFWVVCILA